MTGEQIVWAVLHEYTWIFFFFFFNILCLTCIPGGRRNSLLLLLFPMCIIGSLYLKWLPSLSDWACLTRHLSPLTDTPCGLMSARCANASVSQLLPHYSFNLIHKGAQVTLWGVTHGVCVSVTSYLMCLSPLLFLCVIYLNEESLLHLICSLFENIQVMHVLEPWSHLGVFVQCKAYFYPSWRGLCLYQFTFLSRDVTVLSFLQDSGGKTVLMSSWTATVSNDRSSGQNG